MTTKVLVTIMAVSLGLAAVAPGTRAADARIEGKVTSTTLTKCDFKPGTCEGNLVLEAKDGGKSTQVTIKVPKGTQIKKGNDHLFLPGLKDQTVAITHVEEKGEKVAKSIEVKTAKP